jgi:mono/diheme cytochrome c family protein
MARFSLRGLALTIAIGLTVAFAQYGGPFDNPGGNPSLPPGGNDLLADVLDVCATCDDLDELATAERTRDEWEAYFRNQEHRDEGANEDGALVGLSDEEIDTLTAYLAINLPMSEDDVHDDMEARSLPADGRELVQRYCAACHSLAVSVIPEWQIEQLWLEILQDPHHRGIGLSEQRLEEIAAYLAINPIEPDDVR